MIEELTKEQEDLMEKIYKEYIDYSLSGDDSYDQEKINKFIDFLYKISDLDLPEQIIICPSVEDMCYLANIKDKKTFDYIGCGFDSGWTAFYDFFQRIGVNFDDEEINFKNWLSGVKESGIWATVLYKKVAFVCIRPCKVHFNQENNLHKDLDMAIKWRDGTGFYFLNGVAVDENIAMTPAEKLDCSLILNEKNTQVRSEIIKKIGYSRILRELNAKKIDSWREYELYKIDKIDVEPVVMLKYACPSTGTFYSNRVPPKMKNCKEAVTWMNQGVNPEEFIKET